MGNFISAQPNLGGSAQRHAAHSAIQEPLDLTATHIQADDTCCAANARLTEQEQPAVTRLQQVLQAIAQASGRPELPHQIVDVFLRYRQSFIDDQALQPLQQHLEAAFELTQNSSARSELPPLNGLDYAAVEAHLQRLFALNFSDNRSVLAENKPSPEETHSLCQAFLPCKALQLDQMLALRALRDAWLASTQILQAGGAFIPPPEETPSTSARTAQIAFNAALLNHLRQFPSAESCLNLLQFLVRCPHQALLNDECIAALGARLAQLSISPSVEAVLTGFLTTACRNQHDTAAWLIFKKLPIQEQAAVLANNLTLIALIAARKTMSDTEKRLFDQTISDHQIDLERQDREGSTPLFQAIRLRRIDAIEGFKALNCNLNYIGPKLETAHGLAASPAMRDALVRCGAAPSVAHHDSWRLYATAQGGEIAENAVNSNPEIRFMEQALMDWVASIQLYGSPGRRNLNRQNIAAQANNIQRLKEFIAHPFYKLCLIQRLQHCHALSYQPWPNQQVLALSSRISSDVLRHELRKLFDAEVPEKQAIEPAVRTALIGFLKAQ
ncbi:MAG: hypothetical protein V4623_11085 [Pseudomonadota bacterium]